MRTRDQIYGIEASDFLRNIAMYKTLTEDQLLRFYPGKEAVIRNLETQLAKQGRLYHNRETRRVSASAEWDSKADPGLLAAVWVLLDFIDRAEYHSPSDFPVKITFFAGGEVYEIIYVPYGREILMNHALAVKDETEARRVILVDRPAQIGAIHIPNTCGFCRVEPDGAVQYYKSEQK